MDDIEGCAKQITKSTICNITHHIRLSWHPINVLTFKNSWKFQPSLFEPLSGIAKYNISDDMNEHLKPRKHGVVRSPLTPHDCQKTKIRYFGHEIPKKGINCWSEKSKSQLVAWPKMIVSNYVSGTNNTVSGKNRSIMTASEQHPQPILE